MTEQAPEPQDEIDAAAAALHYTQSGISRRIAAIVLDVIIIDAPPALAATDVSVAGS